MDNSTPQPERVLGMRFTGSHACVLGASSDLGMAVAQTLHEAGISLTLSACSEKGIARITSAIPTATILQLNLEKLAEAGSMEGGEKSEAVMNFADYLDAEPDYLVDCMQSDFEGFIAGADQATAARYLQTNIAGRSVCLNEVSRMMLAKRFGRCVFISSTAAQLPNVGQGFYAATKQAGEALYQNLGIELGRRGVTTCSLRLGYVDSGRGTKFLADNPDTLKRVPARRAVTCTEAARTVVFLLSDDASMINATTLTMDGGLTACK